MSDDGADLGMGANDALAVVLGGDDQETKAQRSPEEMEAHIRGNADPTTYDGCANACAVILIDWLRANPEMGQEPTENEYARDEDGSMTSPMEVIRQGWYETMKERWPDTYREISQLDLTGFMWGWAVNAARYVCGEPPVPNPAIVTIG